MDQHFYWEQLLYDLKQGDRKALARIISLVENEVKDYVNILEKLPVSVTKVIGITGPPGAGKSTLIDALIGKIVENNHTVAVLCVDPSSPFNFGALLGDRIRMSKWYNNPNVFIRSLATRGSLGGLHPKIIEITDLLKAAEFAYVIVETVGVGQSEVEIAGLADTTVVVLVPESGDEVQTMKAGLMEIADIFVVNKSDRPDADLFIKNLQSMLTSSYLQKKAAVIKVIAIKQQGIDELLNKIHHHQSNIQSSDNKTWLLVEKAYFLIQNKRMRDIDKKVLLHKMEKIVNEEGFNLYRFVSQYV